MKVPNGWRLDKLSTLGKWGSGGTPLSSVKEYYNGNIKWAVIGDLNEGILFDTEMKITEAGLKNSSAKLVPEGALLIAMYVSIGKTAITGCELSHNQAIAFMIPNDNTNVFYVKYFIQFVNSELFKLSRGGTQKNINQEILKSFEIPLPSKKEQDKVVEEIEKQFTRLDASVKDLKNVKDKLEVYRQSLIKSALMGNLTRCDDIKESSRELYNKIKREKATLISEKAIRKEKEFSNVESSEIPFNVPNKWILVRLGEIVSVLGDGLHGTPQYTEGGDYAFINGNNLDNGNIVIKENTKLVSEEEYLKYKKELNDNTILVSINGTLGNVAFYSNERVILGKSACYFNVLNGINKEYIRLIIQSKYFFNYAYKHATGSTIKNVSLMSMRLFPIPLPSTYEQEEIVKEMEKYSSVIDKLEQTIDSSLQHTELLRKSILKSAFEGKLVKEVLV